MTDGQQRDQQEQETGGQARAVAQMPAMTPAGKAGDADYREQQGETEDEHRVFPKSFRSGNDPGSTRFRHDFASSGNIP